MVPRKYWVLLSISYVLLNLLEISNSTKAQILCHCSVGKYSSNNSTNKICGNQDKVPEETRCQGGVKPSGKDSASGTNFQCPQFHSWGGEKTYTFLEGDFCDTKSFPTCREDEGFTDIADVVLMDKDQNCKISMGTTSPRDSTVRDCIQRVTGDFNGELWIVYVVHGFMASIESTWVPKLANSVIKRFTKRDRKVVAILVDWGFEDQFFSANSALDLELPNPSELTCENKIVRFFTKTYRRMSSTTVVVGHLLAKLTEEIAASIESTEPIKTFCLGHSLGAQVCGFFGKSLKGNRHNPVADGIIGIDPAGPIFMDNSLINKLDREDAKVVQALHSNAGQFGINGMDGDIDFVINNGTNQPGCESKLDPFGILAAMCSHSYFEQLLIDIYGNDLRCLSQEGSEVANLEDLSGALSGGSVQHVITTGNGKCLYQ